MSVSEKKLIEGACNRLADASLYTSAAIDLRTDGVGRERTNGSESPDGEGSQNVRARACDRVHTCGLALRGRRW
ncbi:hypothetical protein BRD01_09870 [Halobacteriales archaeon QS_8_65_32]|nr:MAG: hypothetical protein BRD01_09870 [Halobacteriales archaeon QS_8_65_32]